MTLLPIRLSYSKLTLFEQCPRAYFLSHVTNDGKGVKRVENAYAQYGIFCHTLIDSWAKGETEPKGLIKRYTAEYDGAITQEFPTETASESYYDGGYTYFENFAPIGTIVESEKKRVVNLFGADFSGVIDMIIELPDGRFAIVDHKSASRKSFYGKAGEKKFRQLYIYSEMWRMETGRLPDVLMFNLFREGVVVSEPFDNTKYNETLEWTDETIGDIVYMTEKHSRDELEWKKMNENSQFCRNLCDVREECNEIL